VEKQARFFHAMEKLSANFPHNGKTLAAFSTQWKKYSGFFHTMEKMFAAPFAGLARSKRRALRYRLRVRLSPLRLGLGTQLFHSVENSVLGLFSGVLGCSLGAVERSTRRPLSTVERADRGAWKNGDRRRRAAPSAAPASGAA